jgi:hypothetical protein
MTVTRADAHHATITSSADLQEFWATMMGAGGFGRRTLWLAFLDAEGTPASVLVPIDDVPKAPDASVGNIGQILRQIAEDMDEVASIAMLLSRPGPGQSLGSDRRWGRALLRACDEVPAKIWPIHLATADRIIPLTPSGLG